MSVNNLFEKSNKFFQRQNYIAGLKVYVDIWLRYPKNMRLDEEIDKKIKNIKVAILPTISSKEIENLFELASIGQTSKVIKILNTRLETNPNDILSISLVGTFYGLNEDFDEAIKFQKLAIEKAPFEIAFYINLFESLNRINKFEESLFILHFAKVLSLKDTSIDHKIAKTHTNLKNYSKANLIYIELIEKDNVSNEIIYSYCNNLIKLKKEKEAILVLKEYEIKNPKNEEFKILIGLAHFKDQQFDLAKSFFLKVIKLNKHNEDAYTMIGDCYEKLGELAQAKNYYDQSLRINPNNIDTINNIAAWYFINGDIKKAEKFYSLAISKNKNNIDARYYLSQCQLAQSNYSLGWLNFEYRWLANEYDTIKLKINLPKFELNTGKKNLLLWGEQGVGDQILFMRFLKDVAIHVENLYVKIDTRLHPILLRSFPTVKFFNDDTNINLDCHLPFGDLPSLFVSDNSYFSKNQNHYINSDFNNTKNMKSNYKTKDKFLCGISWISKTGNIGISKSITLETLKPVLELENVEFIDLQYSDTTVERKRFFSENNIRIRKIDNIDNFNDLNGVCSLIDICDFVITISNTNAHIAGALGKKTFLLLPRGKGRLWYWTIKNKKSIWYPTIEIIEQKKVGIWKSVIEELRRKVKENLVE